MIQLTRINGQPFILNAELIKFVERTPDTLVTLRDGDKVMVLEAPEEVIRLAIEFQRSIRRAPLHQS